jgi:hypothetical protein
MPIIKSVGITPSERFLARLCERSFLKLWNYPSPKKDDGKELCDLLVAFDDAVLVFFDRESRRFDKTDGDLGLQWQRWRKEVVDKQVATAEGAARYIRSGRPLYLEGKQPFPIPIETSKVRVHKIVVAHGAREACRAFSPDNVSGSLAIAYGPPEFRETSQPFFVDLDRGNLVHVFDTENLGIVLSELDTILDFVRYLEAKEEAAQRHQVITYCGEEDLVAHYLLNFDKRANKHFIGAEEGIGFVHIEEGTWEDFKRNPAYVRRRSANQNSYLWDRLIQITSDNALADRLLGNSDPFAGKSAIHFMAREPRFMRRALSDRITQAIADFPETGDPIVRNVSLMPSFWDGSAYVFLQLKMLARGDYDTEYRPIRQALLELACGAAKLRFPDLQRVVGIAIDAPKFAGEINSEDLALMEFDDWDEAKAAHYAKGNEEIRFFATPHLRKTRLQVSEFPKPQTTPSKSKTGRNDPCPCGSGKKYKKCCLG